MAGEHPGVDGAVREGFSLTGDRSFPRRNAGAGKRRGQSGNGAAGCHCIAGSRLEAAAGQSPFRSGPASPAVAGLRPCGTGLYRGRLR
jgi:hypothetical protein